MIRESNGMWIQENKKYVPNAKDLKQAILDEVYCSASAIFRK